MGSGCIPERSVPPLLTVNSNQIHRVVGSRQAGESGIASYSHACIGLIYRDTELHQKATGPDHPVSSHTDNQAWEHLHARSLQLVVIEISCRSKASKSLTNV